VDQGSERWAGDDGPPGGDGSLALQQEVGPALVLKHPFEVGDGYLAGVLAAALVTEVRPGRGASGAPRPGRL
jgi:hypothetical protein